MFQQCEGVEGPVPEGGQSICMRESRTAGGLAQSVGVCSHGMLPANTAMLCAVEPWPRKRSGACVHRRQDGACVQTLALGLEDLRASLHSHASAIRTVSEDLAKTRCAYLLHGSRDRPRCTARLRPGLAKELHRSASENRSQSQAEGAALALDLGIANLFHRSLTPRLERRDLGSHHFLVAFPETHRSTKSYVLLVGGIADMCSGQNNHTMGLGGATRELS
jgi:hypothetical protein